MLKPVNDFYILRALLWQESFDFEVEVSAMHWLILNCIEI